MYISSTCQQDSGWCSRTLMQCVLIMFSHTSVLGSPASTSGILSSSYWPLVSSQVSIFSFHIQGGKKNICLLSFYSFYISSNKMSSCSIVFGTKDRISSFSLWLTYSPVYIYRTLSLFICCWDESCLSFCEWCHNKHGYAGTAFSGWVHLLWLFTQEWDSGII